MTILPVVSRAEEQPASEPVNSQKPHIAVILPLQSKPLGDASEAIKNGIAAAASQPSVGDLPYMFYPIADEAHDFAGAYQEAIHAGAKVVIGPLMLNTIKQLAANAPVPVPTLALNLPPENTVLPNLFGLNLSAAAEAKQIANRLYTAGFRRAMTVTQESPLSQRTSQAFSTAWQGLGASVSTQLLVAANKPDYNALRKEASQCNCDVIFLATDEARTKLLKPFMPSNIPVYTTSQGFSSKTKITNAVDVEGLHFFDMPWLLSPDHPAVMVYPRSSKPLVVEDERLYALGIDALRVAESLAKTNQPAMVIDGVTGQLTLGNDGIFVRDLVAAEVKDGQVIRSVQ